MLIKRDFWYLSLTSLASLCLKLADLSEAQVSSLAPSIVKWSKLNSPATANPSVRIVQRKEKMLQEIEEFDHKKLCFGYGTSASADLE